MKIARSAAFLDKSLPSLCSSQKKKGDINLSLGNRTKTFTFGEYCLCSSISCGFWSPLMWLLWWLTLLLTWNVVFCLFFEDSTYRLIEFHWLSVEENYPLSILQQLYLLSLSFHEILLVSVLMFICSLEDSYCLFFVEVYLVKKKLLSSTKFVFPGLISQPILSYFRYMNTS